MAQAGRGKEVGCREESGRDEGERAGEEGGVCGEGGSEGVAGML